MSVQGLRGACEGDAVCVQGACKECRMSVQGAMMSVQGLRGACEGDAVSVQGACKECRMSVQGGQGECANGCAMSVQRACTHQCASSRGRLRETQRGYGWGQRSKRGVGVKGHEVEVRGHRESGVTPGREVMGSKVTWGWESSPLGVNVRGHRGHKVRGQRLLWVKGSEVNRGHGS